MIVVSVIRNDRKKKTLLFQHIDKTKSQDRHILHLTIRINETETHTYNDFNGCACCLPLRKRNKMTNNVIEREMWFSFDDKMNMHVLSHHFDVCKSKSVSFIYVVSVFLNLCLHSCECEVVCGCVCVCMCVCKRWWNSENVNKVFIFVLMPNEHTQYEHLMHIQVK